jgi:TRAP-type C4-dicarboxylate transport system permease small subunit
VSDPAPAAAAAGELHSASHGARPVRQGLFEWCCNQLAKIALVASMVVIGAEVVMRNLLHYSWEGTDEVGSYLVVAVTFLSLATCQAYGGYHELQTVKMRLPPRATAMLNAALYLVCLISCLILLWQFARLVTVSFRNEDASMTALHMPLWIPQLSMPVGVAALCIALTKSIIAEIKVIRAPDASARGNHHA